MQRKISIIIVTYNSQEYIVDCLHSIGEFLNINPARIEVIVVDNSSGDNATEITDMVIKHQLNDIVKVHYIHNKTNLGYGQGNNIGIESSTGDIICIMNPDVRFGSKMLQDVVDQFENTKLALLGYKQLGGFDYSFYVRPEFKGILSNALTKFSNKFDLFSSKHFFLSGAFFFIDKKKFKEVGCFDENIFMYYEESDITNRLLNAGYKIKYDKSYTYLHLIGNRVVWSENTFKRELQSVIYYLDKFQFSKKKYFSSLKNEYKIKMLLAQLIRDRSRIEKFGEELKLINKYLQSK